MQYKITKKLSAKKNIPGARVYTFLIGLFAIPVIIIAFASLSVYTFLLWIKQLFIKKKIPPLTEPYFLELPLLHNEYIKITVVEDEADKELTGLNEAWEAAAYHDQTYLYRAKTEPFVPALDGKVVGFYLKEQSGGTILQLLAGNDPSGRPSTTQLVYLQYSDLDVTLVDEIGLFHLYNDEADSGLIRGFNNGEEIEMHLHRIGMPEPIPTPPGKV